MVDYIDFVDKLYQILGIYALLLIIFGTIGNIFTFAVCLRPKLRKITCFVFISFMTICDLFTLFTWNLSNFIVPFYNYYHESINIVWCKISVFLQYFTLQSSAWLLVTMSIERFLSVQIRTWYSEYFSAKKAFVVATCVISVIFIFNFHLLISNGYIENDNGTSVVECYDSTMYALFPLWNTVHNYVYSVVPFVLLAVFNLLLVIKTVCKNTVHPTITTAKSSSNNSKKKSMTRTVILITIAFIVLTLPSAITGGYFFDLLYETVSGRVVLFLCQSLSFSYHSFNFIVYLAINKQFKREFNEILLKFRNKRVDPMNSSVTTVN